MFLYDTFYFALLNHVSHSSMASPHPAKWYEFKLQVFEILTENFNIFVTLICQH